MNFRLSIWVWPKFILAFLKCEQAGSHSLMFGICCSLSSQLLFVTLYIWHVLGLIIQIVQLNEAPYLIRLSQNLTSDCLWISVFLPAHKIVLFDQQFYEHITQKLVKTGKYTEINKQFYVKFWLNWRKSRTVSYSFSCK